MTIAKDQKYILYNRSIAGGLKKRDYGKFLNAFCRGTRNADTRLIVRETLMHADWSSRLIHTRTRGKNPQFSSSTLCLDLADAFRN